MYTVYNLPKNFKFYNSCDDVIEAVQDSTYTYLWNNKDVSGAISASDIAARLNKGTYKFIEEIEKESVMNTLEQAQAKVKELEALLKQAQEEAEAAKKKSESKIGLKIPEMGEKYYSEYYGGRFTREDCDNGPYFSSFASTNKVQQKAFQEALIVMAEMRMQDGIVVPDGEHKVYPIYLDVGENTLNVDCWETDTGTSLFPAFESQGAAQKAINGVGEERIINCIKTMMFMTPESRGEMAND